MFILKELVGVVVLQIVLRRSTNDDGFLGVLSIVECGHVSAKSC